MKTIRGPWKTTLSALALACAASAHAEVTAWEPLEQAVFDSGSQINSIDEGFAERNGLRLLGRKFDITGVSPTEERARSVSRLSIGLFGAEFVLRDVPALPHPDMTMILGAGFPKSSVLISGLDLLILPSLATGHEIADVSIQKPAPGQDPEREKPQIAAPAAETPAA